MDKRKKLRILSLALFAIGVIAAVVFVVCRGKTEGIAETHVSTGTQNACIAYDPETDITVVGTNGTNRIHAFSGSEEIWSAESTGAFCDLEINKASGAVYAGNQNNHIYVYDLLTGELRGDTDVQRRIVAIDVYSDASRIAVATLTGTSKANAILLDGDGEVISSTAFTVKVGGIALTESGDMIIGNNRGELILLDEAGEQKDILKTDYNIIQMRGTPDGQLAVCKNGSYYLVDDELHILRNGTINNTMQATPSCVGIDGEGRYIAVGTAEGYLFVFSEQDKEIYTTDIGTGLSDFAEDGDTILLTGYGDFVKRANVADLANINTNQMVCNITQVISILGIVAGLFLLLLSTERAGTRMTKLGKEMWRKRMAYILILPTFILIWMFNYRGILTTFGRAFTNWSLTYNTTAKMSFVGLENFKKMVTEGYFLVGAKNVLLIAITGVIKVMTIPLLCAWLVHSAKGNRRKYLHRFLFVLPIVVPGVISAMVWLKFYDPNIGLINELLAKLGLSNLQQIWLGNSATAIWAVIFMGFPWINAMAFLVYYGGLIGIGKEIEESAFVDGATRRHAFWKIQFPLLKPQFRVMITLTLISAMQNFNEIYILTQGGPGTSTYVPSLELYLNVAQFGRYGYACALGVVLFIMTMLVTVINMRLTREKE